eukprot:2298982-Rhodomonas_salina.3
MRGSDDHEKRWRTVPPLPVPRESGLRSDSMVSENASLRLGSRLSTFLTDCGRGAPMLRPFSGRSSREPERSATVVEAVWSTSLVFPSRRPVCLYSSAFNFRSSSRAIDMLARRRVSRVECEMSFHTSKHRMTCQ